MMNFRHAPASLPRGVTLVEALAAIALIGIVLPVAMQGVSLALGAGAMARRSAEAAALAETLLNELVISGDWQLGDQEGSFEPDWPGYSWATRSYNRDFGLVEIEVDVTWLWRGQEKTVQLSTLVMP
jgi:type II secretory pathway pseudopilin PulG